jgi:hypothetical protein
MLGLNRVLFASIVAAITALSVGWWVTCNFYIGPKLFKAYVESNGKLVAKEPLACKDVDARSLAALSALLATVIAVNKKETN